MTTSNHAATRALFPVTIPRGQIRFAPGMRAGNWVFATGVHGSADFMSGMSQEVLRPTRPQGDRSKLRREADQVFANLAAILAEGGSSLANGVRIDQLYTSGRAVEAYHDARRAALKDHISPSTSTLAEGFLRPGQDMEVHLVAVADDSGMRPRHIRPAGQEVHHTSGYSVALAAGDFVFISGRIADGPRFGEGIAAQARVPEGHLWKGLPVKLETEFIMRSKVEPALKAAGSSLEEVLKCQVYLRDPEDFGAFNEAWAEIFPGVQPATTLIPTPSPGFYLSEARVEINTIALAGQGRIRKETIVSDRLVAREPRRIAGGAAAPAGAVYTHAVRAGDMVFLSGLLAVDEAGLVDAARMDPAQPYFGSSMRAQMQAILENAQAICGAAGTSLANVVRIQQYHTDLHDFHTAYESWDAFLPGQHLPLSAVKVPFLPVPGCTVQLDLWVYAPSHA